MKFILFIFAVAVSAGTVAAAGSPLRVATLTCENIVNPIGIDHAAPWLSWILESEEHDQVQTAYEILMSDSEQLLKRGYGNVWSSGKVTSSKNTNVVFSGKPLRSFTRYYWKVRVYDKNDQPSSWSKIVWFETAVLDQHEWTARWISDGKKQFDRDEDFYQDDPMPLFRKTFSVKKQIQSARLYISGLGYYEAYLNGRKVGDHVLDPGWTTYKKQVLYGVHDITSMVNGGNNVVGVMVGNGWYNPLPLRLFGKFNLRDVQQTGRPCVKAEIHLRYSDGSLDKIVTDETWLTAPGPVIRNNVYLGEYYDARLEQKNWNAAGALSDDWRNAVVVKGPDGVLTTQLQPPIRVTKVIRPVKIMAAPNGAFIADMGQNFAGVVRITVKGPSGTRIKLRYGEALHDDGSLNYLTTVAGQIKQMWNLSGGPGAPPTAWQEDNYILNGTGTEVWAPRFTFHGFRYVEITGWPGTPTVNDMEGLRMNSDLAKAGEFNCSNEMFNRLHEVIQWTFLSNVFSVQSDCPGREKMGYGADIVTTANAFLYNYDMANFYRKTVRDFANEQRPKGGITEIAPYTGIHDRGIGDESGPLGWQLAFPYLQKQLYEFYGDQRIIAQHYPAFQKQMDFLQAQAIDGLFHWDISDHEALDPRPEAFSACAFYYHHAVLASEFAGVLGHRDDSVKYANLAKKIKRSIVQKYHVPNTGRFDNGTQSAQLFALWYGFSPEEEATFNTLVSEFERHQYHVSSGIFGVKMMFDVLREKDQQELAYRLANQRDYPGWGYMLANGATTLWESWKYPDNAGSQNHPMFGSIDEWFYRSLLGINPGAPGFKKIIIKPQPAGDLAWAKGSYHSIHGKIISDWKIQERMITLRVVIPVNTTADVWVPVAGHATVNEVVGGKKQTIPAEKITYRDGYAVIPVGSGEYVFETRWR